MKRKLIILILVLSLILVGCISENTPREESIVSTTAILSSTLFPTEILTPVSTETKTPLPTATVISPTPTFYLTPLPTLSNKQEQIKFYQFFNFINGCRLPCLWGITPGITTWAELKQFINQFNNWNDIDKEKVSNTKSYERYTWYIPNPLPVDFSSFVSFDIENNIVSTITLDEVLAYHLFPPNSLLLEYGQPNRILLDTYTTNDINNNPLKSVYIYLVYEDEHILSEYYFSAYGEGSKENVRTCLDDSQLEPMILWSSGAELDVDLSKMKPLNNFSQLNSEAFYERFKYKGNRCLELNCDL